MKVAKPNDSESTDSETERKEEKNGMEAPVAASRRDVMEAEKRAEQAQQEAADAKRMTVEEVKQVRDEIEEVRADLEDTREALVMLDELVNGLFQNAATPEGEPPLNDEMGYCCPENAEEDQPVLTQGGEDDE